MTDHQKLIPHLFRTEFRKITAVLCRRMGVERMEAAEDIASETFLSAVETWSYKGIPANPVGWLYTVARHKALNAISRQRSFEQKVAAGFRSTTADTEVSDIDFSDTNITDSQLRMLFALCHPAISTEAQIGLSLRLLCGFGIDEIANAFLTGKDTINKRLFRAKEKLRTEGILIELPSAEEIDLRLDSVLTTMYLLFNEGYYSESRDEVLRKDLCLEAMRLTNMLVENPATAQPRVKALLALMCFHASRFDARVSGSGEMILYHDQDEKLWNKELIEKGAWLLHLASQKDKLSKYHLEASIAYWHTIKQDSEEKWENILKLYDLLLSIEYSPVAALNRIYALSRIRGKDEAIKEAAALQLTNNHYYYVLLGDLDNGKAKQHWQTALSLAKSEPDRQSIRKLIGRISE